MVFKFPDITGERFSKIIVLNGKLPNRKALIKCDCGTEKIVIKYDVFNGKIKSCGSKKCVARTKDLVGARFSFLTVICRVENTKNISTRCTIWECKCICGNTITAPTNQLNSGRTKSCGCEKGKWISQKNSKPIKNTVENKLFNSYKHGAKKRNYDFTLTKEEFVSYLYDVCFYCGLPPTNKITEIRVAGNEYIKFNGIDRVDNNNGYTTDNCVTCCKFCNHAKKDLSKEDFIKLAKRIYNKQQANSMRHNIIINEYHMPEIYKTNNSFPLLKKEDVVEGCEVLVPWISGEYIKMTTRIDNNELCAYEGNIKAILKFDIDDRHCWICAGIISIN